MFEPKLTIKELRKSLDNIPVEFDDYTVSTVDDTAGLMQMHLLDKDCVIAKKEKRLYIFASMFG